MENEKLIKIFSFKNYFNRVFIYLAEDLLIDTGSIHMEKYLKKILKNFEVNKCAITHYHEQHSGNAHLLNEKGIIPYLTKEGMELFKENLKKQKFYRRFLFGKPKEAKFQVYDKFIKTNNFNFKVINLKGHTRDSVVLYDEEKGILFLGDLFISSQLKYLKKEENLLELINSIEFLLNLKIKLLYTSHLGPIKDYRFRLENLWFNLTTLRDIVTSLNAKELSKKEILNNLKLKETIFSYLTGRDFSKENFISFLK